MKVRAYLTIAGIIAIAFAIGFLVVPRKLLALYGEVPDSTAALNIRFFASALLGLGVILWLVRDTRDRTVLRAVLIGSAISDAVGCLVNIRGTYVGLLNELAWSTTILYVALLAGALYFLTMDSRQTQ
jgi:hypothetical protein